MPTASLNGSYLTAEMRLTGSLSEPVRKIATSPLMEPPASFSRRACVPSRLSRKWLAVGLLLGMASLLAVTRHGDRSTTGRPRLRGAPVQMVGAGGEPHPAAPGRGGRPVGADGLGRAGCRGDTSRRGSSGARHGHASTRVQPLTPPPSCHAIEALIAADLSIGPGLMRGAHRCPSSPTSSRI